MARISRARVGAAGRGRRRLLHFGSEAVSFACLHHGWVGEGEEISEVSWNERGGGGGGGGGGGLNRWLRAAKELSSINIH